MSDFPSVQEASQALGTKLIHEDDMAKYAVEYIQDMFMDIPGDLLDHDACLAQTLEFCYDIEINGVTYYYMD